MLAHGFLKGKLEQQLIQDIHSECLSYINKNSEIKNYYQDISSEIPSIKNLLNKKLIQKASELIKGKIELKATELHVQLPKCSAIPPHQDNFYHCLSFNESLKFLIPLQKLSKESGGLIYANCNYDENIYDHLPSSISGFSSYIAEDKYFARSFSETSYEYKLGDCSYHFGNSIHRSIGNQTNQISMFIVFRIESNEAKQNIKSLNKYNKCYEEHIKLLRNKKERQN
mgnify:CR=1 FL=1